MISLPLMFTATFPSQTSTEDDSAPKNRIFLVDDHITVLLGLRTLIEAQSDMQVVGYATSGANALEMFSALPSHEERQQGSAPAVDIVVMDVSMPDMTGVETTIQFKKRWPQTHILALSMHEDKSYLRTLLESGASGYVLKRSAAGELIRAIRAIAKGNRYIDPALSEAIAQTLVRSKSALRGDMAGAALSEREEAVLRLVAQGYTNKEIAVQLAVSIKTIETYKARSMEKLELDSRTDIIRYALTQGWLQSPG